MFYFIKPQVFCLYFLFLLCFCAFTGLHGQEMGFSVEVQTRFIQHLSWTPHEYALRYGVEIEREEDGTYRRFLLEDTREAGISVSLPPGNYRYRVIPYDLLNRPGIISEWLSFVVKQAFDPEITGFMPELITLQNDVKEYELIIFGNNFLPESEIYLNKLNSINSDVIIPFQVQISNEGRKAVLFFKDVKFETGTYQINIKNPGGLETQIGGFVVQNPGTPSFSFASGGGSPYPYYPSLIDRVFIGISPEINGFTRSGYAVGGSLLFGFELNQHFAIGQKTGFFKNLDTLDAVDIQLFFRYKLPF